MTPDRAAWVREHAWTPRMRKAFTDTPAFYSMCACEWGPCGHCAAERHELCAESRVEVPPTYVATSDGSTAVLHYPHAPLGAPIHCRVWEVSHQHVWSCPCLPEHERQGDLFDLLEVS